MAMVRPPKTFKTIIIYNGFLKTNDFLMRRKNPAEFRPWLWPEKNINHSIALKNWPLLCSSPYFLVRFRNCKILLHQIFSQLDFMSLNWFCTQQLLHRFHKICKFSHYCRSCIVCTFLTKQAPSIFWFFYKVFNPT